MSLWLVRAGRHGEQEETALKESVVTIGWNRFGDLSGIKSKEEFEKLYQETYQDEKKSKVGNQDGTANTNINQPPKVFAYLPIRPYGFKFIIQADFLVGSNREDLLKDKPWNKEIAKNIPEAFIKALEIFKTDASLARSYYDIIPLHGEITDDFFAPSAGQIAHRLKETDSILTESGAWAKPGDVLFADEKIRKLISNQELKAAISKEYVSSEVIIGEKFRNALGIDRFELKHLFEYLNKDELTKGKPRSWFNELYAYLSSTELSPEDKFRIRKIKIFVLDNGQPTSLSEGAIFYPLDRKHEYDFENELRIIRPPKFKEDKETEEAARKFLEKMCIKKPLPYEIIEEHILPSYEYEKWNAKTSKVLNGYVR